MLRVNARNIGSVIAMALVGVACTVTSAPSNDAGTVTPTVDSGRTATPDGGGDAGPLNCGAEDTFHACVLCCDGAEEVYQLANDAYNKCACEGACGSACTAFCADQSKDPSPTCEACLDSQMATCQPKYAAACDSNARCKAADACARTSNCVALPDEAPDGGDGG